MKKLIFTLMMIIYPVIMQSQQNIEINKEFSLFTSQSAQGYFKPLFTTVGESFNTGLHTTAFYSNNWSLALDFSVMGMIIPNSQKNFDASLPDMYGYDDITRTAELRDGNINKSISGFSRQPTIYGGISNPVFAAPQRHFPPDSFYKSVAYAEGNNISFMPGLPVIQLVAGFPTRTQMRLRFFRLNLLNEPMTYYTIALNQNIDKFLDLFKEEHNMSLAANFAYSSLSRNPGIDMSSIAAGIHFSKKFDFGMSLYSGFQYEGLSGNFFAVKQDYNEEDILNSPYAEVRNGDPMEFGIESFTSFRLLAGLSYKVGIFDFHADAAYASQPVLRAGVSIWIFDNVDKPTFKMPDYQPRGIDKPAPDLYAGRLKTEQKVFPAKTLFVPEKVIVPPLLNAETNVYAFIDSVRSPVSSFRLEEIEISELQALLPYIFFNEGSSELAERYKVLDNSQTKDFTRDSLLGRTSFETYYNLLNILGQRLQQYESANITLKGCNSNSGVERNNKSLSEDRASTIRDYFVNVWEIDSSRISVIAQNLPDNPSNVNTDEGIVENRRVEIESDLWEITAPIIVEDTLKHIQPEIVEFVNQAESEAGISSWELTVYDRGDKLKSYKGGEVLSESIPWDIDKDFDVKEKLHYSFDYSLEVTDTTDQFYITPIKSVPVEYVSLDDKRKQENLDTLYQKFNLILFEFDSAELGADNQRIVEIIKKRLKQNSIVTVNGYTDIIGDETYNQRLSERRAKSSADAINHRNTDVIGWGESKLLYPNDLPEGRFYCRTVVVDVRTPIIE